MPVAQLQSSPVTPEYFIAPSTIEYHKRTRLQTQLLLHLAAVCPEFWITPAHNSPRCKNGSKSFATCLDALDVPQLLLHLAAVSATMCPTWMRWTFLSCSCTWLLSPPNAGLPQVTTAPDSRMAAEALPLAWMCWTLAPGCCLRRNLHDPTSQQPQIQESSKSTGTC